MRKTTEIHVLKSDPQDSFQDLPHKIKLRIVFGVATVSFLVFSTWHGIRMALSQ
jgi:hypothetical protein